MVSFFAAPPGMNFCHILRSVDLIDFSMYESVLKTTSPLTLGVRVGRL